MKITILPRPEDLCDEYDSYKLEIDGKLQFEVMRGEPEDATFSRDLSDIFKIPDLMKMAYEAGKRGEPFELYPPLSEENNNI